MTLVIKAYFFDAKLNYLPYYKTFSIYIEENIAIKEVLPLIKDQDFHFSYPENNLFFRINGLVLDGTQTVEEISSRLGTEITIDPLSVYRSTDGLRINDDDFMQSFKLLEQFASEKDLEHYKALYPLHYASETFTYNNQYIGDAILLLAHKMITEGNEYKDKILSVISEHHDGLWECEYDNNLFHAQDHSAAINELKSMAKGAPSKYRSFFARKYKANDTESIAGRNVAFYAGSDSISQGIVESTLEQIENKGAAAIRYSKACKLAGQSLLDTNPRAAYLKMGTMMLDAIDSGADLLIVHNEEDADLFKRCIGYCEKVTQRDIRLDIMPRGKLMSMINRVA